MTTCQNICIEKTHNKWKFGDDKILHIYSIAYNLASSICVTDWLSKFPTDRYLLFLCLYKVYLGVGPFWKSQKV